MDYHQIQHSKLVIIIQSKKQTLWAIYSTIVEALQRNSFWKFFCQQKIVIASDLKKLSRTGSSQGFLY